MKDKITNGIVANEAIRAREVQLIAEDGKNVGVVSRDEAMFRARDAGLDLVMLSEGKDVPIVKIMDLGKELYERKKKQAEAKKHQKVIQVKEIKLRPKIGEHDYITKMKQGIGFLEDGKHLKVTLLFRGREVATKHERGTEMFQKINQTFQDEGILEHLTEDKDIKAGPAWSKIFYLKK